ncbi:tyrosine-protein phosphatase [Rugosimonospora africana]|uniref:Tyrosine specific protein phosphatases domain-containing protein n=1 Tax=Rugosimonospora africana TaxID=556532 RepID=A0A8J3VVS4_9ACTN|nr:tyrosine-protein phosphatase [Rugosimonospora africana]GIH20620.1 hypothetical protein Raf01_87920 [Rugosimonospora africana]
MILNWDGCVNARDLGGVLTIRGRQIRPGALLRSDSHGRLSPTGIAAVRASGVSQILDLRWSAEIARDPSPLAADPAYRHVPLIAELAEQGTTMPDAYRSMLDHNQQQIASAFTTIAEAPPGGVAVHCSAGRDRTGVLIALVLAVAGVPTQRIAADYALTDSCSPATILRTLAHLDARHGGVVAYLSAGGAEPSHFRSVRSRLLS